MFAVAKRVEVLSLHHKSNASLVMVAPDAGAMVGIRLVSVMVADGFNPAGHGYEIASKRLVAVDVSNSRTIPVTNIKLGRIRIKVGQKLPMAVKPRPLEAVKHIIAEFAPSISGSWTMVTEITVDLVVGLRLVWEKSTSDGGGVYSKTVSAALLSLTSKLTVFGTVAMV